MKYVWMFVCFSFITIFGKDIEKIQPQDIVLDVKGRIIDFNTDNVSFIGKVIDRNIKILDDLIILINSSDDYEKVFPVIVESVGKLAKNYRTIANKKEDIRKTLNRQIELIDKQRAISSKKIFLINKKINETKKQLAFETVDYKQIALKTTLRFQEQECDIWIKFNRGMQFNELISKLKDASKGINKFIDILSVNADVYEQASITLNTIQSYKKATKDLQEVMSVIDLGNDLVESWGKLAMVIDGAMQHIETIENIDFSNMEQEPEEKVKIITDVSETTIVQIDSSSTERN